LFQAQSCRIDCGEVGLLGTSTQKDTNS